MTDHAALAAELAADPEGLGYAGLGDAAVADRLNAKARAGYVPARAVVAILTRGLRWGMVPLAVLHRLLPDGSPCPYPLYNLLATVQLAAHSTIDPPLRLERGPLAAALGQIPDTLIPAVLKTAILASEVKLSRAEELWGYEVVVTPADVEYTRTRL